MRVRSWLVLLAVAFLTFAGIGAVRPAPARAATSAPFRVLTFNVCGGNAPFDYDGPHIEGCMYRTHNLADSMAWIARLKTQILTEGGARTPDVMMFQEMCATQRDLLKSQLAGYQVAWVSFRSSHYACWHWDSANPDKSFGTAIFYKGSAAPALTKSLRASYYPTEDKRALLCVPAPVGGRQALVCTTHADSALADEGAYETMAQIQRWAAGRPVILGGDFNADPFDPKLNAYYGIGGGDGPFTEVDQANRRYFTDACRRLTACRSGEPTSTDQPRKFDYLFASSGSISWTGRRVIRPVDLTRIADHSALRGDGVWVEPTGPSAPDVHRFRPLGWFSTADSAGWRGVRDMTVGRFAGGDDIPDVLVRRWTGEVQVYPGLGGGRLNRPITLVPASQGWSDGTKIVTGDFVGDDRGDDVVIRWSTGTVYAYPGDNNGHLGEPVMLKAPNFFSDARDIAAGDFNGDKVADLLVEWTVGSLFYYPNLKDNKGTLGDPTAVMDAGALTVATADITDKANRSKVTPNGLMAGDVDHDGHDDVVVRLNNGDLVSRALTVGKPGSFTVGAPVTIQQQPEQGGGTWPVTDAVGDLTGDGQDDMAIRWNNVDPDKLRNAGRDDLLVYSEPGTRINPTTGYDVVEVNGFGAGVDNAADVIAGNLVGDDDRDDLLIRRESGTLSAYAGTGTGFVSGSMQIGGDGAWKNARDLVAGDYNGDRRDDIVARWSDGTVTLSPGDGAGHLGTQVVMRSVGQSWSDAVEVAGGADLTGKDPDGRTHDDLVVRWAAGSVYLYPGNGVGGLGDTIVLREAERGWSDSVGMTIGRFDGGPLDDILVRWRAGSAFAYPRLTGGGIGDPQSYRTAGALTSAEGLAAGAFTQTSDGSRDVVALWDNHTVQLYPAVVASSDPLVLRSTGGDIDHFEYLFDTAVAWRSVTAAHGPTTVDVPQGAKNVQVVAVDRTGSRSPLQSYQVSA